MYAHVKETHPSSKMMPLAMLFLAGMLGQAAVSTASTLYVSALGNNSDGSSWAKAYTTVQAALSAIPDDRGGHRIVIRPDTYFEAML